MNRMAIAVLAVCLCLLGGPADTSDMPPSWPWHGVNIDSISFTQEQFEKAIRTVHFNSVQLRLRPRLLAKREGIPVIQAWNRSLDWAAEMLDICKRHKIVAIVSLEGFPVESGIEYDTTSPRFWLNAADRRDVLRLVDEVSSRFAGRGGELGAYQVISEPVMMVAGMSYAPPQWEALAIDIVRRIRSNDAKRWIAISPAPWGLPKSYEDFRPLPFERIIYCAHMYTPQVFTHQGIRNFNTSYTYPGTINGVMWDREQLETSLAGLHDYQETNQVPIWIGEFSAIRWAPGAERYIHDLVEIFNKYGWGWTYYSLNGWHGWNPDYDDIKPESEEGAMQNAGNDTKRWHTLNQIFNP